MPIAALIDIHRANTECHIAIHSIDVSLLKNGFGGDSAIGASLHRNGATAALTVTRSRQWRQTHRTAATAIVPTAAATRHEHHGAYI